jgi:hypothetical protein
VTPLGRHGRIVGGCQLLPLRIPVTLFGLYRRMISRNGRPAGDGAGPRSLDPSTYQAVVRPIGEFGEIGLDKLASDMPRSQT